MSEGTALSRRELLRQIGVSVSLASAGAGVLPAQTAGHVHHAMAQDKAAARGVYKAKRFNAREYAALQRLAEIVVPGAQAGGAPEFIDFLCSVNEELADIFTGGLAWLDNEMQRRFQTGFAAAQPAQQTAMLDLIAYRRNDSPALGPGIRFFEWARNLTVDAYYSSPAGIKELGYMGNSAMSEFSVPREAVDYALKHSPLGE